eukprot:COSAG01_NODE_65108_length_274_cov_0.674286_1_plen_24_part_10
MHGRSQHRAREGKTAQEGEGEIER